MTNRRTFLKTSALAAVAPTLLLRPDIYRRPLKLDEKVNDTYPRPGDARLRQLTDLALDAARSSGAIYADVRLTATRKQIFNGGSPPDDSIILSVGVRALVDGAWGFVAGPEWSPDEMGRLGKAAADQARANVWPGRPPIELVASKNVVTGDWSHPVRRDPLEVSVDEKLDFMRSTFSYVETFRNASAAFLLSFRRQERTFASTDGAFLTQTLYNTFDDFSQFMVIYYDPVSQRGGNRRADFLTPTSAGYEAFEDLKLVDHIPQMYEEARELTFTEPVPISKYKVVFDGYTVASLVSQSLGAALEYDRAIGLEANADGTSYLAPPENILGSSLTSVPLNIVANRSQSLGAATVKCDDDGVLPEDFELVSDGKVIDYSTSRDTANDLGAWYKKSGLPFESRGCSWSSDAGHVPLIQTPNLQMKPENGGDIEQLVAEMENGLVILGGSISMDHQKLTGYGTSQLTYQVRNGKIQEMKSRVSYLVRAPELWKSLLSIGSSQTLRTKGFEVRKGQPSQVSHHSVEAPAALFNDISIVDISIGRRRG